MGNPNTVHADARHFLDDRGNTGPLAPNGLNPATIMEKAVRERIVDSYFYKEQCFALNEADIVDRVVEFVSFIGGTYGDSQKPTPFLCLAFKLLQLGPSDEIVQEYLNMGGEHFKYLRALAVFYVRMTRGGADVYKLLEPFLEDRRKLRWRGRTGTRLTYMDSFVDDLLCKERVCGTSLWKMPAREVLEDAEVLEARSFSDVEAMLEEEEEEDEEKMDVDKESEGRERSYTPDSRRSRSYSSRSRSRSRSHSRSRSRSTRRSRSRIRSPRRSRSRSDSRSRSRSHSP